MIECAITGIGMAAPGIDNWNEGASLLREGAGFQPGEMTLPPPPMLPPNERRRSIFTVRLALKIAEEAVAASGEDRSQLPAVFASCLGDGKVMNDLCLTLADRDRAVSPTIFHNSVHNAPAGYWSIATGAHAPATSVAAGHATFVTGLLEAATIARFEERPVLLAVYDMVNPPPLNQGIEFRLPFGMALVLSHDRSRGIPLAIDPRPVPHQESRMEHADWESVRTGNPAGRALPLLERLAQQVPGELFLPYHQGRSYRVALGSAR